MSPGGALAAPGGGTSWGAWCQLGSVPVAELLARAGWDWLVLDAQHGLWDDASVHAALAALPGEPAGRPVLVRVREAAAGLVGRALDAGAAGVVVPLVSTAAQAREVAAWCRYAPAGVRSWGPTGVLRGRPVPAAADARPACAVMVETPQGLDEVGEIAAAGVDAVLVGPFDLSLALGTDVDALLGDDAAGAPLPRVVAACRAAGTVPAAFAGDAERAARLAELGFTAVAATTDAGALTAGSAAARLTARRRG